MLEARDRPGGRVQTLRTPFTHGLHAEAGALFVPSHHELTHEYVRDLGLSLEPALPLFQVSLIHVRGRRVASASSALTGWPFGLTAEEQALGLEGLWRKYIGDAVDSSGSELEKYDRMSALDFLRWRGASPEAIAVLRLGYLDMMADGIESYSALQLLRRLALQKDAGDPASYTFSGGAEVLPKALAARLGARIRYEAPVVRIERRETSVDAVVGAAGGLQRFSADHLVCALPFSVLKHVDVSPRFPAQKARAIEDLPYTSVVRVFLQFRRKAWTAEGVHMLAVTDLPIRWIFEHTIHQPGPRGILEAQAFGSDARRLALMTAHERIDFALSQLEQVFPGVRQHFELGVSKCWDEDPWARGAFAYFRPGQMLSLLPHLGNPEGRVHFAGDHTSVWSGWIQGALESGLRAAGEVMQTA